MFMAYQTVADIGFYALVHHVLEASREWDEHLERRTGARREFSCLQWVAPYRDGKLPEAAEFTRVQCIDLSEGGFSYLAHQLPEHEFVMVALGSNPFIFVTAEITRRWTLEMEGQRKLALGCRFVAKLEDAGYAPNLGSATRTF